jgi:hypothetical protein
MEPDVKEIPSAAGNRRSGNPQKKAPAAKSVQAATSSSVDNDGIRIIKMMANDIHDGPVHDLLFRTEQGLEVVVTVASEFYTPTTNENLRAGEFRVVGKVTRVLGESDSINLTRRTVMGAAGPDIARDTIEKANAALSLGQAHPIVEGPALQILPMSIFV